MLEASDIGRGKVAVRDKWTNYLSVFKVRILFVYKNWIISRIKVRW